MALNPSNSSNVRTAGVEGVNVSDVVWDFGLVARPVSDQSNLVLVLVLILWTRSCKWHEWLCFVYCLCSIFPLLTYLTLKMHDCWWMMTFAGRYCTCELQLQFFVFTCIIALWYRSVVLVLVVWIRSWSWSWSCEIWSWSWFWSCTGLGLGLVKLVLFQSLVNVCMHTYV